MCTQHHPLVNLSIEPTAPPSPSTRSSTAPISTSSSLSKDFLPPVSCNSDSITLNLSLNLITIIDSVTITLKFFQNHLNCGPLWEYFFGHQHTVVVILHSFVHSTHNLVKKNPPTISKGIVDIKISLNEG